MARQTRKAFSPEFKREAVRLLERGDKEAAQLARELGVRRNQLYKWQQAIAEHGEAAFPGHWNRPRLKQADDPRTLQAIEQRSPGQDLLVHSDRGKEYYASDYQALLKQHGLVCSMSRLGNCYDNAAMESFFHSLKVEQVHHDDYRTRDEARSALFDYIEVFYNRRRRHSTIGYQSPVDFEEGRVA